MIELFKSIFAVGGENVRLHKCHMCGEFVRNTIKIPSDVGYWVCYDCFSYWIEDYPLDILLKKFAKYYRN